MPSSRRITTPIRGGRSPAVKERSTDAILEALVSGATYTTTGPEIHDIRIDNSDDGPRARENPGRR